MPLPKPKKDESHDDFMDRCMSDEVMVAEYEDEKQRHAVCQNQWDDSRSEDKARRSLSIDDSELRVSDDDGPKITGYAAKFGKWSVDLGGFVERIRKGAFDEALKETDTLALKNHDRNLILGRTTSGTLRLKTNSVGLRFEIDPPDTTTGRDAIEEIRRKDIAGCSFSFIAAEDDWKYYDDGRIERTIIKVGRLFDIGPVAEPAYRDTTVSARSLQKVKEIRAEKQGQEQEQPEPRAEEKTEPGEREKTKQETQEERDRRRRVQIHYDHAGRIINHIRNKSAEV
jgi:HK97 family phage prohead protease